MATGTHLPQPLIDSVVARYGSEHRHGDFDPGRAALIVVDMQYAFLEAEIGFAPCAAAVELIPAINHLAAAIRAAGGHVIWLKNIHDEQMPVELSSLYASLGARGTTARAMALSEGQRGFELAGDLKVEEGDPVVVKRRYSAFVPGSSDLDTLLKARGIETLIVTGCTTDVCVESTARDAMMMNYRVIVVSDGTAAMTESAHLNSLCALYAHFADVMPAAMVVDRCHASLPQPARG